MGITCKPIGKMAGMIRKIDNQNEKDKKAINKAKGKEKTS